MKMANFTPDELTEAIERLAVIHGQVSSLGHVAQSYGQLEISDPAREAADALDRLMAAIAKRKSNA